MKLQADRREEGVLILQVEGRVDGANADEFLTLLRASIGHNDRFVILDLEQLSYVGSAGLRILLMVAKKLHHKRGILVTCSLSESARKVFDISGIDKVIPVYPSRADAIKGRE